MAQDFGENPWFTLSAPFPVCVENPLNVPVSVDTLTRLGYPGSLVMLSIPPHGERCYLTQMEQQDLIEPPSLIVDWSLSPVSDDESNPRRGSVVEAPKERQ